MTFFPSVCVTHTLLHIKSNDGHRYYWQSGMVCGLSIGTTISSIWLGSSVPRRSNSNYTSQTSHVNDKEEAQNGGLELALVGRRRPVAHTILPQVSIYYLTKTQTQYRVVVVVV